MLAIKLQRIGKKHQPSYRLVVAERRSKMGAPPTEDLGAYNPATKQATFNKERVAHWLKVGAQPTVTVHNLLAKEGLVTAAKLPVKMKKKAAAAESKTVPASKEAEVAAPSEAASA